MPRHTFSAVLGAVTAAGRNNAETFQYFRPGFDLAVERERREAAGLGEAYTEEDLYPDVRPALAALREMGLWVGIAGNQTAKAGRGDPFVSRTRYPGLGHYVVGTGSEQAPDRHVANLDPARGCRWPEPRGKLGLGRSGAGGAAGARPDPGPARVRQAARPG